MGKNEPFPVPPAGTLLPEGWFSRLVEFINSVRIIPGPGLRVNRTPGGTILNLVPQAIPITPSGSGGGGYTGEFLAVSAGAGKVRIVNGADPGAQLAGITDIGEVPAATLDVTSGEIFLLLTYADGKYSQSFGTNIPNGAAWWRIAVVSESGIRQRWMGGSIYWSERYFV